MHLGEGTAHFGTGMVVRGFTERSPEQVLETEPAVREINTAPRGPGSLPGTCESNTTCPEACRELGWLFVTAAQRDSTPPHLALFRRENRTAVW